MKKITLLIPLCLWLWLLQAQTNVVFNKTIVSTSSDITIANAAKAIDGSSSTVLNVPASSISKFIVIDMQGKYDITTMTLEFSTTNFSRTYRISASSNNTAYTEVALSTLTAGGVQSVPAPASLKGARYLKLELNADTGTYAIDLKEFTARGSLSPVNYAYDDAGNRTTVNIITLFQKSALKSAPVLSDTTLKDVNDMYIDAIADLSISVFPNPTKGLLKVNIENFKEVDQAEICVWNINGQEIYRKKNISSSSLIDLSNKPSGIYIMKIMIGGNTSEWKIIKE